MFRMPISATARRAAASALAAAALASGSVLTSAPAADAAPAPQAARPKADRGFTPVDLPRAVRGAQPLVVHASAPNQVWVAARGTDGRLVMLLRQGASWTVHRTSVAVAADAVVTMDGGARDEVWVAAGQSLLRFDGKRWNDVSRPDTTYLRITDAPGTAVYAAWKATSEGTYGNLHVGSAAARGHLRDLAATGLGAAIPAWARVTDLEVSDGTVFVAGMWQQHKFSDQTVASPVNGKWTVRGTAAMDGYSGTGRANAFIPRNGGFLFLGENPWSSPNQIVVQGLCKEWTPGLPNEWGYETGTHRECTTAGAVGAAAERSDGRIVIGGRDEDTRRANTGKRAEQGTFRLRERNGKERVIQGDPGDATLSVAVQPRTNTAWAVTKQGGVNTLQQWG